MSNQLVKKNPAEGYQNIFPKTWIDAIKDKESGVSLQEILQGFNMYFLSYNGSRALTRCKVPSVLRKEGLWITYVLYDHTVVTEWYNSDQIDDNSWSMDSNWRVASNFLIGDVSVSADGYWVINGEKTEAKAQGEQGVTPLLRVGANNKLQVSYNAGKTWKDISDYIVPRFRWNQGTGTSAGNVQISMDLGKTWTNLSNEITNNLRISRYIDINESLPTSGVAEGTIYMKGPYYDEGDTSNANPIYRMWVYAWKGNTLAWQDNGEFTTISAGVVQERGTSTTGVMSQDAVSRELIELESEITEKADKRLGNNIIDPDYVVSGYLNSQGNVAANDVLHVSGYLPVESGQSVTIFKKASSSASILCFAAYDKGLNFVRAVVNNSTYTQHGDEAFVRCTLPAPTEAYLTLFANYGASLLAYEPFVSVEDTIKILRDDLSSLNESKLDKVYGNNLIDPHKVEFGYLNRYGVVSEPDKGLILYVSDFIPVGSGQSVQLFKIASSSSSILSFAAYDSDKSFVRGLSNTASYTQQDNEAYIRMTLVSPTTDYPTFFANYGTELEGYQPFTDNDPLFQLKRRVDNIAPEMTALSVKLPDNIYCICDDVTNYSLNFFADHCVNLGQTKKAKLIFKETGNDHLNLFAPISNDGSTLNGGKNALEQVISGTIVGDYADKDVSFKLRSILNTFTANTPIRVLCIGDSVTAGTGSNNPSFMTNGMFFQYWTIMHRLCARDKANHNNAGYDYLSIGKQSSREYYYNDVRYKDYSEGRGGWTIANYLFDASLSTINNYFYDGSKVWSGTYADELNAAGVKFSLASYLSKYKTLADDGVTRLVVGSTAGTEITDINECDVCTPNIIVLQLSHNQNSTAFANNIPLLVKAIKNEYPNIPILVSLLDETGCYNSALYHNYNPADLAYSELHEQCYEDIDVCRSLETSFSGVYYCPSNFIQPTAFSVTIRGVNKAESFINEIAKSKLISLERDAEFNVRTGVGPNYHPSCIAHAAWAYQMLAMIKWVLNVL